MLDIWEECPYHKTKSSALGSCMMAKFFFIRFAISKY